MIKLLIITWSFEALFSQIALPQKIESKKRHLFWLPGFPNITILSVEKAVIGISRGVWSNVHQMALHLVKATSVLTSFPCSPLSQRCYQI